MPSIVGTLVTIVGRYIAIAFARLSGVGRSLKSADRRADREREHQVRAGRVAEEEARHADGDVVAPVADGALRVDLGVEREVAVRVHVRLRLAGRAAREEPDGRLVAVHGRELGLGRGLERGRELDHLAPPIGALERRSMRCSGSSPVATSGTTNTACTSLPGASTSARSDLGDLGTS